jgi:hypothetical protein
MDIGPNLAITLLDISESGARLTVKSTLEKGQLVAVSLEGREHLRPIKCTGTVIRSNQDAEGVCQIALLWEKRLSFADILRMT